MAVATNQQVQEFADSRVRTRAEAIRSLVAALRDDKASIDDVYAACVQQSPTWVDTRPDGPPRLLTAQDILNYNAAISLLLSVIDGTAVTADVVSLHSNINTLLGACVRPIPAS